ncbi:ATP synthase F1 subunit delta [Mucilaginibacter sp. E4BP6]|uniref:ATP synthase F1 subunit delta n=1 Tax=Mucilaginibacter sp. E4BP6 TaxID=2723089 RepID=UPI0015CBFE19|nr:ATP synthase F1 subunit delta [Mucilaginibacter sp. E4BP6]NYE67940.1 F-type H+-transporting ATPase subunit delta [Mucilaginibacter sp. E4BP6]
MSEITVAIRYAKSLIDLAVEQKALEAVNADMEFFVRTIKANSELNAVLVNPIIYHDKKIQILDAIFGGKVSPVTIAFFKLMVNKNRAEVLYPAAQEFINQYDVINNIIKATVVSAAELSEANKKTIVAEIEASTKGTVKLTAKVAPALIGGFILTVGDRQVDTSISSSLTKLKKEFSQAAV